MSDYGMRFDRYDVLSVLTRLGIACGVSYVTVKVMMDLLDPTRKQKADAQKKAELLLSKLNIQRNLKLTEHELMIASQLLEPKSLLTTWEDIGGLTETIKELRETVILPLINRKLFNSRLLQPPKGVLLHGPPGCGKTLLARATASESGMQFINLQVSILTDKWYGESQKLAAAVFSLAVKIQPCIVFIDEIDCFLRTRTGFDHEATAMMKSQFLSLWDGIATRNDCMVVVMGATNRPSDLDSAILRRMPCVFRVNLPNQPQRESILRLMLRNESVSDDVNLETLAGRTDGFSGSDLYELCRTAAITRVREVCNSGNMPLPDGLRAMTKVDFDVALKKLKSSSVHGLALSHSPGPD
ncbi:unnamed protein product [Notodromas monacha]|uniref:AAA+ ATPase domain-containing protein n=1 Tax=Notodromas monacha TaxID=399045 RepID=A0A7R9BPL8_9CRUS|nr:unnamed protein product [Notodromas monacha]CAG0917987.1 unnamed protein product [Notodromas monacha]